MTDINNEVSSEQQVEQPNVPIAPAAPQDKEKAKPNRASRAKPKEAPKKEPPREEPKEEQKEEQKEEPKEEQGAGAKVECPDCGKQMFAKTLRYSHGANCPAKQGKQ